MEKEIMKELDFFADNQKEFNGFLVSKIIENELQIKQLKKEITGLIILQGLSALALTIVAIWG